MICSVHFSWDVHASTIVCPFQRPKKDKAADNVGGYTCEFVDQPPDDLLCKKCNHVAKNPQQLKCCGEFYCKSCLASWNVLHKASCSVKHKNKNEPLDHFFDHKSNERIQKLKVECTNLDQGCDWTGELKDLDDHRSQCPKEEIPCTFSDVGCETRPLREYLNYHITQDQQQHLHCAMMSILRLRQELATTRKELASTRGELQKVQETLSKCMDEVQTLPMTFKMSNYAQFKETGDTWYSTPFYSRKSRCRLRLCVRPTVRPLLIGHGWNQPENATVALEVFTSSKPYISLKVEILNQVSDAAHLSFTPTAISTSKFKSCGEIIEVPIYPDDHVAVHPLFSSGFIDQQKDPVQYLYHDCLFFRVSESEKPWLNNAKQL